MGGPSSEHEVSLKTGQMILKNLDKKKFKPLPIKIEKDGSWPMNMEYLKSQSDIVFVAMHGEYGEDGQVQSLLETFQIPYTGSDPIASAIAMDKSKTLKILRENDFLIPDYLSIKKSDPLINWRRIKRLGLPLIIKPTSGGSSVGINLVNDWDDLKKAISDSFNYSDYLIIQKYISGRELTCGVLEINGTPISLLPTEIIPKEGEFFDYNSKYKIGGSKEITPPNLPKSAIKEIQKLALAIHKLIGCSGMSRTDMILGNDGKLYILEINTIPGMTETSLLPQAAEKMGISFPKLLEIIIDSARN